jgi:hypothetical protein
MRTSRQDAVWWKKRFSERAKLFDRRCFAAAIHAFPDLGSVGVISRNAV